MAKQQKKAAARRTPRASEPRMYGDGKPSQPAQTDQAAAERPAVAATRPAATPNRVPTRTPSPRAAGVTPRGGAGAGGSYARVDRIADYGYVMHDLRRLGIVAVAILAGLVVLGLVIH